MNDCIAKYFLRNFMFDVCHMIDINVMFCIESKLLNKRFSFVDCNYREMHVWRRMTNRKTLVEIPSLTQDTSGSESQV